MTNFLKKGNCLSCALNLNLLCHMSGEQLDRVNKGRKEVVYRAGETIFKSGGILTHIVCIKQGMVKVYLESDSGKNIMLAIAKTNEMIGGPGFLVDGRHYHTATALEDTTVCLIDVDILKEVMLENPEFSMAMVKYLNERIIKLYEKMLILATKQAHGRVADILLYLSNKIYNSDQFETPLTRQDFADMSAIAKESLIRVLKEFDDDLLIKCGMHRIEILDKKALKKISNFG